MENLFKRFIVNKFHFKISEELKHFIMLSFTSAINHSIRLFTGVINAKLLTPHLYGINTMMNTLVRYSNYSHIGAQSGLNRQIPIDIGLKHKTSIFINLMSVFWFLVFISIIIIIITFGVFFSELNIYNLPKEYLFEMAGISISNLFSAYFTSYLVSTQQYKLLSKLKIYIDTSLTLITVLLVYYFKLHGLFIGIILAQLIFCIVVLKSIKFKISFLFSFNHLGGLIFSGFPIMLSSLTFVFFSTIDFVYLLNNVSMFLIGIYGFALTGVAAFRVYTSSLGDILSPKMGILYGVNNQNKNVLFEFINKYNEIFIISLGAIGMFFYLAIPTIINCFLPDYVQSITPFKMILLGAIGLAMYIPSGIIITILKKNNVYTLVLAIISIITYALFIFFVKADFLFFVPLILFIMSLLFSISVIFIASFLTTGQSQFNFIGRQLFTFSFIIILILFVDNIYNTTSGGLVSIIIISITKLFFGELIILGYLYIKQKNIMFKLFKNQ